MKAVWQARDTVKKLRRDRVAPSMMDFMTRGKEMAET
jgi:hypothetical protein